MLTLRGLLLCCVMMPMFSVYAAVVDDTARSLVEDIASYPFQDQWGSKPLRVLVLPLKGASEGVTVPLARSVVRALGGQRKWKIWDEALLRGMYPDMFKGKAVFSDQDWQEISGALGAQVVLAGDVLPKGNGYDVSMRAVWREDQRTLLTSQAFLPYTGVAREVEDQRVDAQLRRLADRVTWGLDKIEGVLKYQRFAVLPLDEMDPTSQKTHAGLVMSSRVGDVLRKEHGLMVLGWAEVRQVLKEAGYTSSSSMSDPYYVQQLCEKLGVQGVVLGTVYVSEDKAYVHVQVQSGIRGEVVMTEEASVQLEELFLLSEDARELRGTWGAVARSAVFPGWGQIYQKQRAKGLVWMSAELLAIGAAGALHALGKNQEQRYSRASYGDVEGFAARDAAESRYRERNIVLWTLLGLHVLNTMDALLFGGGS